jgi:hypothetical protein
MNQNPRTNEERSLRETLSWDQSVPLLTNRFILKDMAIVLVASLVLMQLMILVVGYLAEGELILLPLKVWLIVAGVLAALFVLSTLVLLNRAKMVFTLDDKGAWYEMDKGQRRMNRTLFLLAVLARRPGAAGTALAAASQESGGVSWRDVRRVTYRPGPRAITLSNSWRPVLRVYCPKDGYEEIAGFVRAHAIHLQEAGRKRPASPVRHPWRRWIVWAVLTTIAAVAASAWPELYYESIPRFILLGGFLVLVSGFPRNRLRTFLGVPAVIPVVYVLLRTVMEAARPIGSSLGLDYGHAWELDSGLLSLTLTGMLGLLALAVVSVVQGVRGTESEDRSGQSNHTEMGD